MTTESLTITVEFDNIDDAAYALMFLGRCEFSEFYARTEPHLGRQACTVRAYRMRDAVAKIERALAEAQVPRRIYD
jgi:hypothetical protein